EDLCTNEYSYARRQCGGLCAGRAGAQTFYCHLGCAENATNAGEYTACKDGCRGANLTETNCRINCELITQNDYMCGTICGDDIPSFLQRCLFVCAKTHAPKEECGK
uniref:Uncharacterized protein n=1 Tax=Trichobilharzia regenti TaxID=157069 RepID=A0AA85K7J9_TRIRE